MTKRFLSLLILLSIMTFTPFLTGCADMVEIQERDFVMALGISYDKDYEITFALPNLDAITGQSADSENDHFIRTFQGASFPEIIEKYNINSKNRLDLRHLQAIVFDPSITEKPEQMSAMLSFLNDNYELSHNVLVFFCSSDVGDLMAMENVLDGSIGDYLQKLNKNNKHDDTRNVTIGHLITAQGSRNTIAVPVLARNDDTIYLDGSALFQNNQTVHLLTREENVLLHIMLGEGSDYLFHLPDQTVMQLNTIQATSKYSIVQNKPFIVLTLRGTCQAIPATRSEDPKPANQLNLFIKKKLEKSIIPILTEEQVDFLNLYEKSSYKHRDIWFRYQENPEQFLKDLHMEVRVDFSLE